MAKRLGDTTFTDLLEKWRDVLGNKGFITFMSDSVANRLGDTTFTELLEKWRGLVGDRLFVTIMHNNSVIMRLGGHFDTMARTLVNGTTNEFIKKRVAKYTASVKFTAIQREDFTEVAQIVRRALADPDGYGNTVAFDSVDLLCEVADTACFTDVTALEEFMVLKGFKVNNYGGVNLRWFETKDEFKHGMGEEATRQGKMHIITLTGRMEVSMVILWSRAFLGVMDPVKRIKAIGHSKTYDGVIRHMIEEAVCEWAVDVRSSRVPTRPGYASENPDGTPEYALDEPDVCARLLKHYIEDVIVRLTPMEHGEATRPRRLTPIQPAPHTAFFAKGGPFRSVLNREGSREKSGTQTEKGSGTGGRKETGDTDGVPAGSMMITPDPKPKRDKGEGGTKGGGG